jgi:hypothetical protein
MFEALRGLRDAVAPESGNLASGSTNIGTSSEDSQQMPHDQNQDSSSSNGLDFEEFWQSYRNQDPDTLAAVRRLGPDPHKREDYVRIFRLWEREKDATLVGRLAQTVLQTSREVDRRVENLSGMERTQSEQMVIIKDLLVQNDLALKELVRYHGIALTRREQIRSLVLQQSCEALGIEELKY